MAVPSPPPSWNVLGLFAAGGDRDRCDKNEVSCADLSQPLGCNFIWPGVFPGTYYLIVQAFKAGDEGTVQATLAATAARTEEICDNGVDDNGDGLVDCDDPTCVDFPACAALTCHPGNSLGSLPINGASRDVSVTTEGAAAKENTSCQAQNGGGDVVIGFSLPRQASVTVSYGQFGNHVFALFNDLGQAHACDKQQVDCQPTSGNGSGMVRFANLPAGPYFLVVKALQPGDEGPLALRIAGTSP
jgi:hypothetical protein